MPASEVEPSYTKLDLERFYEDLPKYMPFLSKSSWQHWEQFRADNPTSLSFSNSLGWSLPEIYRAAILSSQQPNVNDHSLSAETLALLAKETNAPKPVSCYYLSHCVALLISVNARFDTKVLLSGQNPLLLNLKQWEVMKLK